MFVGAPELLVLQRPNYWAIARVLTWRSEQLTLTIPAGFVTDLASIPRALRAVLDVNGPSRDPAILHDWLYCSQRTSRAFADHMLFQALVSYGETQLTAGVYWLGVRIGGWVPWDRRLHRGGGIQPDDFVDIDAYDNAMQSRGNRYRST